MEARIGYGPTIPKRKRASSDVVRLIDRIRELVAEKDALEGRTSSGRLEALRLEIERLQCRLANVVRRELSGPGPSPCPAAT
jgi:hypothetical protein